MAYAAHRDPVSEVAASTLGRNLSTSVKLVGRVIANREVLLVPQVPQRELRRRLHPELHENLQLFGCYSAVCAPIGATGALLVTRDLPGRPYTNDDLAFVESIAARATRADERARAWTVAWKLRRRMVEVFSAPTLEGNCFETAAAAGRRRRRGRRGSRTSRCSRCSTWTFAMSPAASRTRSCR